MYGPSLHGPVTAYTVVGPTRLEDGMDALESDVEGLLVTEDGWTLGLGRAQVTSFVGRTLTLRWPTVTTDRPGRAKAIRFRMGDAWFDAPIRRQDLIPSGTFTGYCDVLLDDISVGPAH